MRAKSTGVAHKMVRGFLQATAAFGALLSARNQAAAQSADSSVHLSPIAVLFPSDPARHTLIGVNSETVERARFNQLQSGVAIGQSLLLRSASTLTPPGGADSFGFYFISPQLTYVNNSAIPFSQNNGSLWAGKGGSFRALLGFRAETKHLRVVIAPELVESDNADWILRRPGFYAPPPPAARAGGGYVFPYYIGPFSIDQPMRFGPDAIRRVDAGQSSVTISMSRIAGGYATENEWWGPGIRNAIVLSDNAPGFPHIFLRTSRPLMSRFGAFEG